MIVAQNICKCCIFANTTFCIFVKCDYNGGNLGQILRFYKLQFPLTMLMLLYVQVVQTNNNESSWNKRKKQLSNLNKQKICELIKKVENLN